MQNPLADESETGRQTQINFDKLADGLGSNVPDAMAPNPAEGEPNANAEPKTAPVVAKGPAKESLSVLPEGSDNYQVSLHLNQMGSQCRNFGWWPQTDEQVNDLKVLVSHLDTAQRIIDSGEYPAEKDILSQQLSYWRKELKNDCRPVEGLDDPKRAEFNRKMIEEGNIADQPFLVFGEIHHGIMESPEFQIDKGALIETITVKVLGTDQLVMANVREGWPVLRPGTSWLMMGQFDRRKVKISGGDNGVDEVAVLGKIYFVGEAN